MNKKGNAILDGLTIIIIIMVLGISFIFGSQVLDELNTDIQSDSTAGTEAKSISSNLNSVYTPLFDNLFLFAFVLLLVFILVSVFLLDTHPIFFIVSVILLIFVFVVAGLLANSYNDIASDSTLSTFANNFTYMAWVMSHLLETMVGIGFLITIALFIKFK